MNILTLDCLKAKEEICFGLFLIVTEKKCMNWNM